MKIKEKRIISEKENNQSLIIQKYSVNKKSGSLMSFKKVNKFTPNILSKEMI